MNPYRLYSTSDLTGNNTDGNQEIFLAVCDVDTDGDEIPDTLDNCPGLSNHEQVDTDQDEIGDLCDNCPDDPNSNQEDSNGDGIGDACETTTTTTTELGGICRFCPILCGLGEGSEETELLRYFRDEVLSKTAEGQEIIRLYYQWGPVIAKAMEGDEEFKLEVKELIDEMLPMIEEAVE